MAVEPYLLSSVLNGVVAQRLARTVCSACATKYFPAENVLRDANLEGRTPQTFRRGGGCEQCHNSGYRGRIGIYEVMEITSDLRRLIHQGAATHEMREKMRQSGVLALREEGISIALQGKTTLEEVLAVTHTEDQQQWKEAEKVLA
jgi:type II secretory ATPase GspE/PulE/Tfp pilus assembly ATPase PilB-like protein